jgi:diguanylate cyclase (GGDEF)-like protein
MRLLTILLVTIFVADGVLGFGLAFARLSPLADEVVDAVALTALLFPVLYFGVFKAIAEKNALLTRSARSLLAAQDDLERRIDARTIDLAKANETLERSIGVSEAQRESTVIFGETVSLLQACQSSNEIFDIVAMQFQRLLPNDAGAIYIFKSSRNILERAITWNSSIEFSAPSFPPNDCWALRMGKLHECATSRQAIRCRHFSADAGRTVCLPVTAAGEVLGSLSFCFGRKPAQNGTAVGEGVADDSPACSADVGPQGLAYLTVMVESLATALANMHLREALRNEATHDVLTGLFNRRFMDEAIDLEFNRAERNATPFAVVMLDVDHFKQFNDLRGHDAGDAVLAALGACINRRIRKSDIACRYGGEEILIVLPGADTVVAARWAETIRQELEHVILSHQSRQPGPITVSCGVASYPSDAKNKAELIKAADEALYRSKADGRNRVSCAVPLQVAR